jgi:hypothetical protein
LSFLKNGTTQAQGYKGIIKMKNAGIPAEKKGRDELIEKKKADFD